MIDWSRVEELRDEIGAEDFDEVDELFLSEVEDRIDLALTKAESESFEEDLHFLKGSALNLGFDQFAQLCGAGEQQAANGLLFERMDEIFSAYKNSKKMFLEHLSPDAGA
ncbi:MAG: Hpt domain-containing protein [Rhodobacteraceae bacterium]|jgi:HPt (histidine-containing phosphotransfer) domain-containing protein|nr:Hpt protein [Rhodobacteraceae bacterium HTCC2083]MBT5821566.1 Hpt domain-containing protein [Paracoccaceae bacterium]